MNQLRSLRSAMIIDDHPLYCEALMSVIKTDTGIKRVEIADSLDCAMRILAKRFIPHILFLDLNLPDVTGMSGFLSLKRRLPNVPIVVISATTNSEIVTFVKEHGGAGYLSKNLELEKLKNAIEKIVLGGSIFPHNIKNGRTNSVSSDEKSDLNSLSGKIAELTPQQTKILLMISEGMLNKQIAFELDLAEATIKTHITALMRKLDVQNRTQAALLVKEANISAKLE